MPSGTELPVGLYDPHHEQIPEATVAGETNFARDGFRMLRRHKLLFVVAFILPCIVALAIAFTLPPVYSASSTVLIETNGKDVVTLREVLADVPADSEAVTGEIQVLASREMLERVASTLKLEADPEFNAALRPSQLRAISQMLKGYIREWLGGIISSPPTTDPRPMNTVVDALRRHLLIAPVGQSRVIQISFTSRSPSTAAAIVNTLAELYTQEHLRLRDQATRQANDWIYAHIAELRKRADESAAAVEQYRSEHGLVQGRDSLLVRQQVTDASTQLTAAKVRAAEATATYADAEKALAAGHPERIAAAVNSQTIQQLRQQEAQLAARRLELSSRFGDAYPAAAAATAQLRGVQSQISAEVARIVQSLRNAAEVARADQAALASHLSDARKDSEKASTLDVGLQQLQREADVDNTLYQTFLTRSKETDPHFNYPTVNVRVLSRAVPPDWPVSPNRPLIAIAGVVLGLCAGIGAAVLRDLLRKGLRTREDVERLTGLAPIGVVPLIARRDRPLQQQRVQEAVASLWARMSTSAGGSAPKSVVVTSAVMREGKTTLSRLLGTVAAEHGRRVLLIDADMRCASLTAQLGARHSAFGLAEVIRGEVSLEAAVVAESANLHVLPAGDCCGSPVRLLASAGFSRTLREAERNYDCVIVDSPPVLIGADAWLLGCNAQATILIARWGRTAKTVVEAALRQLLDVGVRRIGLVLSGVNVNKLALYDDAVSLSVSRHARRYYAHYAAKR